MTRLSFIEVFSDFIIGENLYINKGLSVKFETFFNLFRDAESLDYNNLINLNGENDKFGFRTFFDKCKEQGILH